MSNFRFTEDHEWVNVEGDIATIGISEFAQEHLGDVVFVELPDIGKNLTKGEPAAVVESVKAASDVYAPVSGEIVAVNSELKIKPEIVNQSAVDKGWFFKIKLSDAGEFDGLMTEEEYKSFIAKSA